MSSATDSNATPSTDEIVAAVSSALKGDRKKVNGLVAKTRRRLRDELKQRLRSRVRKEIDGSLNELRNAVGVQKQVKRDNRGSARRVDDPRGARLPRPTPLPLQRTRPVRIRRPNNRWVRGHLAPSAARRDDLERLRRITEGNANRAYDAIRENAQAIDRLAASQRELAKVVAELQSRGELALLQGLLDSVQGLDLRMDDVAKVQKKALDEHKEAVKTKTKKLGAELRRIDRGAQIQKLRSATSTMQAAAYGAAGSQFSRNNLLLAGNQLLWDFFGELLVLLGLTSKGQTSPWGWLSPVASIVTGQLALGNEQHVRFITGIATDFEVLPTPLGVEFPTEVSVYSISLQDRIGSAVWPEFQQRDDIPVSVTPLDPISPAISIDAQVIDGVLFVRLLSPPAGPSLLAFTDIRIAWMVDTGDING